MILVPVPPGQLGNQLFSIAHLAAASLETGMRCSFPCFGYPLEHFPAINSNENLRVTQRPKSLEKIASFFYRGLRRTLPSSPWHLSTVHHDPPFIDIASLEFSRAAKNRVVICEGFGFRAIDALARHRAAVSEILRLSPGISEKADAFLNVIRGDSKTLVFGFHIRRGDYRSYCGGRYCFSDDDWTRWIRQCRQMALDAGKRFQGLTFSNEPVDQIIADHDDVAAGPGGVFDDLAVLSKCDYLLGPPSTYSGWASFSGVRPMMVIEDTGQQCAPDRFQVVNW